MEEFNLKLEGRMFNLNKIEGRMFNFNKIEGKYNLNKMNCLNN